MAIDVRTRLATPLDGKRGSVKTVGVRGINFGNAGINQVLSVAMSIFSSQRWVAAFELPHVDRIRSLNEAAELEHGAPVQSMGRAAEYAPASMLGLLQEACRVPEELRGHVDVDDLLCEPECGSPSGYPSVIARLSDRVTSRFIPTRKRRLLGQPRFLDQ